MKFVAVILGLLLSTPSISQIGDNPIEEYQLADMQLNNIYKQLIKEYSHDSLFVMKIRVAQRNWLKFRDSELEMMFPENQISSSNKYTKNCRHEYLTQLTKQRTEKLKRWLAGTSDFVECSGSIFTRANDGEPPAKLINDGEFLTITARMQNNHHFFGYASPDFSSEKLLLFSIGTSAVENNWRQCKYGAYYERSGEFSYDNNYKLRYVYEEGQFVKSILIKMSGEFEEELDIIYFDKEWVK